MRSRFAFSVAELQVAPDLPCERGLAGVIDIQDAVLSHQSVELMPMVGHPWGKGCDAPVQVGVALLAAKTEQVHPLRGHARVILHDGDHLPTLWGHTTADLVDHIARVAG